MDTAFNLDLLLDALAERIAAKLGQNGGGTGGVKPRLLSVEEAAVYLGRTRESVQHMLAAGKLPAVRIDRRVCFDIRDLDRLIESSKS